MTTVNGAQVHKLVIACDAGMGTSVMLASALRGEFAGTDVQVEHTTVTSIPTDADLVLCHDSIAERARGNTPGVPVVGFRDFLGDPLVQRVVDAIKDHRDIEG
ncbi:MAG: hypothetical protein Q7T56_09360 [Nocardioidaceae bacterium]|nr:hypothetical protein [Nocardioidaceae bacterium]